MGRGLSGQQKDLLRAARAVNAHINCGQARCRVEPQTVSTAMWWGGMHKPRERTTALHDGRCDIDLSVGLWLVARMPARAGCGANGNLRIFDSTNAQKAAISRALSRLAERGLLIAGRYEATEWYDKRVDRLHGYLLTERGLELAATLPELVCVNLDQMYHPEDQSAFGVAWWRGNERQWRCSGIGERLILAAYAAHR